MYGCSWGSLFGAGHGFMGVGMYGMFWNILIVVLVLFGVMKIIQSFKSKEPSCAYNRDPLDILKEKFSHGEISEDEFRRMREVLLNG